MAVARSTPAGPQTGPFISYSRSDRDFVVQLHAQLQASGRDAWVDWEDIPHSAEWMQRIQAGIDAAPAVLCVISPAFVASRVCAQELQHAMRQGKKLVPLLLQPVPPDALAPPLQRLNWLVIPDAQALAQQLPALIDALETDLDWQQAHARLLVRAAEWAASPAEASALPRGQELARLETRLASLGASQQPRPTTLQREYLLAARQAETRRQRHWLAGVVAVLVLTLGLAALAWQQRGVAQGQAQLALSRLLAQQSGERLAAPSGQEDTALLLAAAAVQVHASAQTHQALWQALQAWPPGLQQARTGHTLTSLAVSPDGRLLALGGFGGQLDVWDSARLQPAQPGGQAGSATPTAGQAGLTTDTAGQAGPATAPAGQTGPATLAAAFSPDGATLATASLGRVLLRHPATGAVRRAVPVPGVDRIGQLAWSPDGQRLLAAGINNPVVAVIDVAAGQVLQAIRTGRRGVRAMALSADGQWLAVAADDGGAGPGGVGLWHAGTGQPAWQQPGHTGVRALAFSPDGQWLALAGRDGQVRWAARGTGQVAAQRQLSADRLDAVAFSPDGRQLAAAGMDRIVRLLPLSGGLPDERPAQAASGHGNVVVALAFSPDSRVLYSIGFEDRVLRWPLDAAGISLRLAGHPGGTLALAAQPGGTLLASAGADGAVRLWDAEQGRPLMALFGHAGPVQALAFGADGRWLASGAQDDPRILLWDVASGRLLAAWPTAGAVLALAASGDGRLLASSSEGDGQVRLHRLHPLPEGQRLASLPVGSDAGTLAFGPDGRWLVAGTHEAAGLYAWDLASGTPREVPVPADGSAGSAGPAGSSRLGGPAGPDRLAGPAGSNGLIDPAGSNRLIGPAGPVQQLANDGQSPRLAVATDMPGTVQLWPRGPLAAAGAPPLLIDADTAGGIRLALSPGGQVLAHSSGEFNADLTLRQADAGQPLLVLDGRSTVQALAFVRQGTWLASGQHDGAIVLRQVAPVDWLARACAAAGRDLTPAEWRQAVGSDFGFRSPCPRPASTAVAR